MKIQGEFGPENHPLEIWSIRLHGLFSVGILLCIGMLIEHHILTYFKRRKHLWTGLTLAITLGWLSISGYLIYYLVDDTWREYTSLAHWVIGLAVIVLFLAHLNVKRFSQAS